MVFSSRIEHYEGYDSLYSFFDRYKFDKNSLFDISYNVFYSKNLFESFYRDIHKNLSHFETKLFLSTAHSFLPLEGKWIWSFHTFSKKDNQERTFFLAQIFYKKDWLLFKTQSFPQIEIFLKQKLSREEISDYIHT